MTDLTRLSIAALGDLIRTKAVSAVDVTRAHLDRIAAMNQRVNAFVLVAEEVALSAAREADSEIQRGIYRGPLHGIPIGHKDLYCTKEVRTTAASRLRQDFVPEEDATVVAHWRRAGTVMLGKLNTHEFAFGPTNESSMFGPCRNPWDVNRISGGSSGGSGAAVALGMCAGATGSDTGGSIRIPSACCGITGLKPTYGRASRYGIFPLCWSMDHPGPMARTVRDCALLLQPMAGHDRKDRATATSPVPDYANALAGDVKNLRVGVPREYFYERADPEVADTVDAALRKLEELGAVVDEVRIPYIEFAAAAALVIYLSEATAYHDDNIPNDARSYTDQVRTFLELGNYVLAKDYLHAQRYRQLLGQGMTELFKRIDLLVTPTLPVTATKIGQQSVQIRGIEQGVFSALLQNTEPFNLTGLPALALPCGMSEKRLPISMQIIGRPFSEATVLRAGDAFQQVTDWHSKWPEPV